jgi:hypothetical protein
MFLAFGPYGVEALTVEVDKMLGVVFSSRDSVSLEAGAGDSGAAETGCGGDEFHQFKGDFLIAAQRSRRGKGSSGAIAHGNSPGLD